MTKKITPLHRARKRASQEFNLPIDDARVHRLAAWLMLYENVQVKLALGDVVDIGELQKIDDALAAIRNEVNPPHPTSVTLSVVDGRYLHCPSCGFTARSDEPAAPQ
jgi:hypothetical protein